MSSQDPASYNGDIVIAVMGVTGVGKSSFIASVTGRKDIIGHSLSSETSEVNSYQLSHRSNSYVLIDTPGFDDSTMSNDEVTARILSWLQTSYSRGTYLNGVIYIHNITNNRMQGSAYKNMRLFRQLCGEGALGNVVLATSFWDQVTPTSGTERETELKESKEFWADMVEKGSEVVRIKPDRSSCIEILESIAAKRETPRDTTSGRTIPVIQSDGRIQKLKEVLKMDKKAMKDRVQATLAKGEAAHKKEVAELRAQQEKNQERIEKMQQRAEIKHSTRVQAQHKKNSKQIAKMQRQVEKAHERNVRREHQQQRQHEHELRGVDVEETGARQSDSFSRTYNGFVRVFLYVLACLWTILLTALLGSIINDAYGGNPALVNFCMFATVWSWLSILFGLIFPAHRVSFWTRFLADASAIFWSFLAVVPLTVKLSESEFPNSDWSTKRRQELQACAAFFWLLFVTDCLNLIVCLVSRGLP